MMDRTLNGTCKKCQLLEWARQKRKWAHIKWSKIDIRDTGRDKVYIVAYPPRNTELAMQERSAAGLAVPEDFKSGPFGTTDHNLICTVHACL